MDTPSATAEVNIHLRARAQDRDLIDQAAELAGINRSQFMLSSALKEAKNLLLDQMHFGVDAKAFQKILAWTDKAPTAKEAAGLSRLMSRKPKWTKV
jgi:uncharacterized protein (DUF1778 family)